MLEDRGSSLTLAERGDVTALPRHPDFRLLAAMNPATDAGKHDLPAGVRNRFTGLSAIVCILKLLLDLTDAPNWSESMVEHAAEVYTPELSAREDLLMLVNGYLAGVGSSAPPTDWIVAFYIDVRRLVHESLQVSLRG